MKKNTMEDQDGIGLTPDLLIPLKREADKCKQDEMTLTLLNTALMTNI